MQPTSCQRHMKIEWAKVTINFTVLVLCTIYLPVREKKKGGGVTLFQLGGTGRFLSIYYTCFLPIQNIHGLKFGLLKGIVGLWLKLTRRVIGRLMLHGVLTLFAYLKGQCLAQTTYLKLCYYRGYLSYLRIVCCC